MTQSIDDKIHGITSSEPEKAAPKEEVKSDAIEEISEETNSNNEIVEEAETNAEPEKAAQTDSNESDTIETDDYGLEVPKERTYSEKEVQQMIRDRLSRGNHAQPAQQAAVQQATQDFKVDPNSEDSWEAQLDAFIDRRLETREKTAKTKEYQQAEQEIQANFEANFTTGMERHKDFQAVVGKMPITDSMMMSIRDMENPATFLYAAAKLQPEEVRRIAAMTDPFQQAKAMGQLDERMKKAKNITKSAAPLKGQTSDVSVKYKPTRSLDDKIQADAKAKRRA